MGNRPIALVWHRRDLRVEDNVSLSGALRSGLEPVGVFFFDPDILGGLPAADRRVEFIHRSVAELAARYAKLGLRFVAMAQRPIDGLPALAGQLGALHIFAGRDYELGSKQRDQAVGETLQSQGLELHLNKEHVIFESNEVLTLAKTHFSVFTPYKNAWLKMFGTHSPALSGTRKEAKALKLAPRKPDPIPTLEALGFEPTDLLGLGVEPGEKGAEATAKAFASKMPAYGHDRDFPWLDATSRLGPHLRFGTISSRQMALWAEADGSEGAKTWLTQLIWREFYSMMLDSHPELCEGKSFRAKYDSLPWGDAPERLDAWRAGLTGVPIVDAGMRELAATGHMHNRVRMIAASYLVKHLDCDWRHGEAHFAKLLLDYDLANNNGGWQWCASTGSDAQPYFRVFNPHAQSERFDPQARYIKKWLPELASCPPKAIHDLEAVKSAPLLAQAGIKLGQSYPRAMVQHASARQEAIDKFAKIRA